ncbi:MAG TPA: hypothetical protein VFF50_14530 [Candidatus Deferrimicrobiaceae bacterium]|nr:hypothetical protein [Candidatus Deferrimicrobiaceae bacterium]
MRSARWNMLVELARPVTLISTILSLYALFHTAFLIPASGIHQRIYESLEMLALAAAISLVGGLAFSESTSKSAGGGTCLTATLPVRVFLWSASAMLILFVISWYVESHCVLYRDVRF